MMKKIALLMIMQLVSIGCLAQTNNIKPPTVPETTRTTSDRPPKKPTTGTLSITSTPSDAAVKIDGEYMGTTPLTLKNRKAGTYHVTISAEGYETQTQSVTITAGKTATCNVTLKKKAVQQPVQPQSVQQPMRPQSVQQPVQPQRPTTTTTSSSASSLVSSPSSSQTFTANGVSFKMIRVEGGTFTMGATSEQGSDAFDNEKPAHSVTLTSYFIGETEVTQSLWYAVMGNNPSKFKGNNRPVEKVSWDDCQTFISKLNSLTGKNFRLPTEAEWEFAARGGKKSKGYKYSGSNTFGDVAWYIENAYYCGSSKGNSSHPDYGTHPVKMKSPNELGIYDMSGNVWEWCQDWYDRDYYQFLSFSNPLGPSSGSIRVHRGGGWLSAAEGCRVSLRGYDAPATQGVDLGLRLALSMDSVKTALQDNRTVKIHVIDQYGEPMVGATAQYSDKRSLQVTDLKGNCTFTNVHQGDTIEITYIGFDKYVLKIDSRDSYEVILRESRSFKKRR